MMTSCSWMRHKLISSCSSFFPITDRTVANSLDAHRHGSLGVTQSHNHRDEAVRPSYYQLPPHRLQHVSTV